MEQTGGLRADSLMDTGPHFELGAWKMEEGKWCELLLFTMS